ncbi:ribonuclease H-like domain-containing protein [Tanacetum coccineum]
MGLMTIDEGQINWVEQTTDEELNHALMAFTVNNEDHPLKHMEHIGIFDSGCSGHMTGNRAHLKDYQELSKVGSVTFGGSKGSINGKECFVVSFDFKMPDENQVLLKVPRQHNMYTFDMNNVDSSTGYTCLLAKASSNEAKLWHRRLGYLNFKNLNKLVKDNLVRGLPSKSIKWRMGSVW